MTGLLLRLAGPLQSWGEHSSFSVRDTALVPTRSALIGMIASARGWHRGQPLDELEGLTFTVRADRPGTRIYDFHTVGGGLPASQTVPTAEGKRRQSNAATIVSRRYYLTDAVFVVAVTGEPTLVDSVADALTHPVWAPYLGRRSCPAEQPFFLAAMDDPAAALEDLPLNRRAPYQGETVDIDFITEQPLRGSDLGSQLTLNDVPIDFNPQQRRYRSRQIYITRRSIPAAQCSGIGTAYLDAIATHLQRSRA